jgi:hypothetical protein
LLKNQATIYKSNFLTANPYFKFSVVAPAKDLYIGVPKEVKKKNYYPLKEKKKIE